MALCEDVGDYNYTLDNNEVSINILPEQQIAEHAVSGRETALWRAVLLQACIDLSCKSVKPLAKVHRVQASLWFRIDNADFIAVCHLADIDPDFVIKKVQHAKDELMNLGENRRKRSII